MDLTPEQSEKLKRLLDREGDIDALLRRDDVARHAAAYIRTILVWTAGCVGAVVLLWDTFRSIVKAAVQ